MSRRDGQGHAMRGRIRIAAVGLVAMTLLRATSSGAGGQSNTWSSRSDGDLLLIGRRRIASLPPSLPQFSQPRPRCLMSLQNRSVSDQTADRHRARPSGPPPFPLRSRGPARRRPLALDRAIDNDAAGTGCFALGSTAGRRRKDLRRIWRERQISGNRCCELLGTGWRNSVPSRGSRRGRSGEGLPQPATDPRFQDEAPGRGVEEEDACR